MSRHDEAGVISRKRRAYLARFAKRTAAELLLGAIDREDAFDELTEQEDDLVREKMRVIAKHLSAAGQL